MLYTKEELKGIAEVVVRHENLFVMSDEIYEHINFVGRHQSIAQFENVRDRVVTVNGGQLSVEGSDKAFDDTFLADDAKNIVMGEGIGVISGALDGTSVVIGESSAETYTVSGSYTSYLKTAGITIELLQNGEQKYSASYQDDSGSYELTGVLAGTYTLCVSKTNHVTRDYEITVSGDMTQDVKIHPIGDISGDGKITAKDYAMANAHAMKSSLLSGYALKCGDVLKNDGKITTADASRINAAAIKSQPLW